MGEERGERDEEEESLAVVLMHVRATEQGCKVAESILGRNKGSLLHRSLPSAILMKCDLCRLLNLLLLS